MGNALVTLILTMLVLVGVLTLASGSLYSLNAISGSWKQMEQQMIERNRTQIGCVNATANATQMEIIVANEGNVSLNDFAHWDVIVQYYDGGDDYHAEWLPYTTNPTPSSNQWTVDSIFFQGGSEAIEPGILNPGEEMEIIAELYPAVGENTTVQATVATFNGICSQIIFQEGGLW